MNKDLVIATAKYLGALAGAIVITGIAAPAVKEFFGIKKKEEPPVIPSEDIEEDEISEDE